MEWKDLSDAQLFMMPILQLNNFPEKSIIVRTVFKLLLLLISLKKLLLPIFLQ